MSEVSSKLSSSDSKSESQVMTYTECEFCSPDSDEDCRVCGFSGFMKTGVTLQQIEMMHKAYRDPVRAAAPEMLEALRHLLKMVQVENGYPKLYMTARDTGISDAKKIQQHNQLLSRLTPSPEEDKKEVESEG